jgi:hypothetical protein
MCRAAGATPDANGSALDSTISTDAKRTHADAKMHRAVGDALRNMKMCYARQEFGEDSRS